MPKYSALNMPLDSEQDCGKNDEPKDGPENAAYAVPQLCDYTDATKFSND